MGLWDCLCGECSQGSRELQSLHSLHRKMDAVLERLDTIMGLDQDLLTAAQATEAALASEEDSLNELLALVKGLQVGTVITAADVAKLQAAATGLTTDRANVVAAIAGLPTPITLAPASLALSLASSPSGTILASEAANAAATFTAASSDPTIATVAGTSPSFTVTAVAVGSATITVTDENGATAPAGVVVAA